MKNRKIYLKIIALALVLIWPAMFIGCGGDGGGDGDVSPDTVTPAYDATGRWLVTDTETQDSHQLDPPVDYHIDITQNDNRFSIDFEQWYGSQSGGTVNGDKYSMTFDHPEEGGTTTYIYSFTLTSEDAFSGGYSWEWKSPSGEVRHNGRGDLAGTKVK